MKIEGNKNKTKILLQNLTHIRVYMFDLFFLAFICNKNVKNCLNERPNVRTYGRTEDKVMCSVVASLLVNE